jgi:sec-independent protein translocase protein TatA
MGELLTPTHLMLAAAIALILFGGNKLPELGKGLGARRRGFKDGSRRTTVYGSNRRIHYAAFSLRKSSFFRETPM